ncbi:MULTISPECIES: MarR family winged helix-turn-helix transcriptional regulator [unclassified Streptomyces]|uniref:MarR family winged helix-turn-helix transcriptional regulator n=1 Tax=unclassified Streptomyces TaxID=2593676 RepID=UPI0006AE7096|nr:MULTISPECIES: MarR family transcriptional regulator [unclassified Streptomyces]KOX36419.1 MarR family transcriptional regulator [Streptomyces sp. NRRL F-6491]KOX51300.1 MarR family transcriptional regulator [Streptomyces sp. NRRL F-6492]
MTQKGSARREALMTELHGEARRYMAAYALFNQAVADHLGLHPTDVQCLNLLSLEGGPVTTGRIAELTGLTTGSATRLVDRLERAGYVTRARDTEDRRRVLVSLAPGRAAELGALWRRLNGTWGTMFDVYSDAEVALLIAHMRRTVEVSAQQVERLREGDFDGPDAPGGDS